MSAQLALRPPPSALRHLPSAICHLPFAICHFPFLIRPPPATRQIATPLSPSAVNSCRPALIEALTCCQVPIPGLGFFGEHDATEPRVPGSRLRREPRRAEGVGPQESGHESFRTKTREKRRADDKLRDGPAPCLSLSRGDQGRDPFLD